MPTLARVVTIRRANGSFATFNAGQDPGASDGAYIQSPTAWEGGVAPYPPNPPTNEVTDFSLTDEDLTPAFFASLATQAELNTHAATSHGGTHPDLPAHNALGLATDDELAAHALTAHGGGGAIADLTDVDLAGLVDGDLLGWSDAQDKFVPSGLLAADTGSSWAISKPPANITRTSNTLGPLSTPFTVSVTAKAGQKVHVSAAIVVSCAAAEYLFVALAKGGTILTKGQVDSAAGANHGLLTNLEWIDESPTVGVNTYEVYVASFSGLITVEGGNTLTAVGHPNTTAPRGNSILIAEARDTQIGVGPKGDKGDTGAATPPLLHLRDQKASGVGGGTFTTGAWQTRTLNTIVTNELSGVTVVSNVITGLPAGVYEIDATLPGFAVNAHQGRLYNVTGAAVLILGTTEFAYAAQAIVHTCSLIKGRFTLAGTSNLRLEHRCSNTYTDGFGKPKDGSWDVEVYTEVLIRKIS